MADLVKKKITNEDVIRHWKYHLDYLVEILNGEYKVEDAQSDIMGLIESEHR